MHSMTTNDEKFYEKYEKFIHDFIHMKNMTWQGLKQQPSGNISELQGAFKLGKELEHEEEGQMSQQLLNHEDGQQEAHGGKFDLRRTH